jgi:DNA-binding transcriptional LysR family regulator
MEIEQLKYFLQICEDKSISKSAKQLFLSQQGLSKIIKHLELELEVPLFIRGTAGLDLTEYGVFVQSKALGLVQLADGMKTELKALQNQRKEILNIAVSFGVISSLPTEFFSEFQELYPHISLNISEYQDYYCEQTILDETADLGFSIAPVDSGLFDSTAIIRDKMCLLVHESNPLSQKEEVTFEEIKNERFLLLNKHFKIHNTFVQKCNMAGFEPNIILTTLEMILIHNLSRANKGVGIGVHFIGTDIPNVCAVPFKDSSCSWEVCVITKKHKPPSPAVLSLHNYIVSSYPDLNFSIH